MYATLVMILPPKSAPKFRSHAPHRSTPTNSKTHFDGTRFDDVWWFQYVCLCVCVQWVCKRYIFFALSQIAPNYLRYPKNRCSRMMMTMMKMRCVFRRDLAMCVSHSSRHPVSHPVQTNTNKLASSLYTHRIRLDEIYLNAQQKMHSQNIVMIIIIITHKHSACQINRVELTTWNAFLKPETWIGNMAGRSTAERTTHFRVTHNTNINSVQTYPVAKIDAKKSNTMYDAIEPIKE